RPGPRPRARRPAGARDHARGRGLPAGPARRRAAAHRAPRPPSAGDPRGERRARARRRGM
ncbi:MAG: hypothetical protein AVDCRST_MAG13-204, partial [uncultured Solirubrobacteraceae bacterium]